MTRNFMELLRARMSEGKFLCVGLDSDVTKIPKMYGYGVDGFHLPQFSFNLDVIDATADLAQAYKIQIAFYAAVKYGHTSLERTIDYIKSIAPDVPIILDAKRGDIGNSASGYVAEAFEYLGADAVTVNPYMGLGDAIDVFTADPNKGVIVLCRTSNPGAGEFQNLPIYEGTTQKRLAGSWEEHPVTRPLYQVVADQVATRWNANGNCAVVVGATNPEELASVRRIVGDMPILVPGFGAQGGKTEETFKAGLDSSGSGLICNVSRALIFPEDGGVAAAGASWDAEFRRCQTLALANN